MSKRTVITNPSDAEFLRSASVFVVDIETNTQPPPGSEWSKDNYGTSYVTDMTTVAFYVPGHDPVVLDVRGYPQEMVEFIRSVFDRPNYTVIGHYVLFDLRMLGGHFGFMLPRSVKVYDTRVMSALLMFGEPEREKGKGQLSLQYQVEQFNLLEDEDDKAFYATMKDWRGNLHELSELLRFSPPDSVLWRYTRGFPRYDDLTLPDTTLDEHRQLLTGQEVSDLSEFDLSDHAQDILTQYAAMDVIFPYKLYEIHQRFIDTVSRDGVKLNENIVVPKWDVLPTLVDWEQRISWVSANLAIRGIHLDKDYALLKQRQWADEIVQERDTVLAMPDRSHPYAGWVFEFQTLMWYTRVLNAVAGRDTFTDPDRWIEWNLQTRPSDDYLASLLIFDKRPESPEEEAFWRESWASWLNTLDPSVKRAAALKSTPQDLPTPRIDLVEWVRQQCFSDRPALVGGYLARIKTNWLTYYYTRTQEIAPAKIVNSDIWKPYHLFVVCGIEIPTREEIQEEADLTTDKFRELLAEAEELAEREPGLEIDELALALRSDTLSLGKNAIAYYLKRFKLDLGLNEHDDIEDDNAPPFVHYAKLMQAEANFNRATEFLMHAQRDGKIHSTVDRGGTRTHRYSSTSPNLQNINMKTFKGFLVAPPGFVLVGLDFANAENKMGAMIAGDDAFAFATESGDFHYQMLRAYLPDEVARLEAEGAWDVLKDLRNFFKRVTFAIPYGAGAAKIARIMKKGIEDARRVIAARKAAFPRVEQKKKEVADNCLARWKKGLRPAYVPLWTGSRVIVPAYTNKQRNTTDLATYKTWNYLQQGGVAEMVARAKVLAYEMLLDKGYETFVVLNVHDEIILAVKIEEWPHVVQEVIQIMCSQVPVELRERTLPAVHFVTEVGPENAQKWGWRYNQEYPFSLEHFINQWGYHKLPDSELAKAPHKREAPTWVGPVHEGWTLEAEMEEARALRAKLLVADQTMQGQVETETVGAEWFELNDILSEFDQTLTALAHLGVNLKPHRMPTQIKYIINKPDGTADFKVVGPFQFPERMVASRALLHNGHEVESYDQTLGAVKTLLTSRHNLQALAEKLAAWEEKYGHLYWDAPNA